MQVKLDRRIKVSLCHKKSNEYGLKFGYTKPVTSLATLATGLLPFALIGWSAYPLSRDNKLSEEFKNGEYGLQTQLISPVIRFVLSALITTVCFIRCGYASVHVGGKKKI